MSSLTKTCKNCGIPITTDAADAGKVGPCPQCGELLMAPFPGYNRIQYWCWQIGVWMVSLFFLYIQINENTSSPGLMFLVAVMALPIMLYVSYERAINIGISGWWSVVGLTPFGYVVFGFLPEGLCARPQKLEEKRQRRIESAQQEKRAEHEQELSAIEADDPLSYETFASQYDGDLLGKGVFKKRELYMAWRDDPKNQEQAAKHKEARRQEVERRRKQQDVPVYHELPVDEAEEAQVVVGDDEISESAHTMSAKNLTYDAFLVDFKGSLSSLSKEQRQEEYLKWLDGQKGFAGG